MGHYLCMQETWPLYIYIYIHIFKIVNELNKTNIAYIKLPSELPWH